MLQDWLHGLIAQTASPGGAGLLGTAVPFILIFAVMYFIIIRPQQKQAKQQQSFISQLKKGDEIVLQSGLFGRVFEVADGYLQVELAPNVKVKVLKNAVTGPSPLGAKAEAEKKS